MADNTTADNQTNPDPKQSASETTGKDNVIPKQRLDQEIAKKEAIKAELDALRVEIDELKKQKGTQPAKDSQTDSKSTVDTLLAQVKEIQDRDARRELQRTLGLPEEHAQKVQDIMRQSPDLKPSEALHVARQRHADLFQGKDQRGFDPGTHGGIRPTGGGAPAPETLKQKVAGIKTILNPIDRDAAERRMHGEIVLDKLAASMGLHKKAQ